MLHLIITARDLPPLTMMKRRAHSNALVLTREDLLFTDDETRGLFRQTLDVELNSQIVAKYRERTRGWITALQLVRQVAEQEIYRQTDKPALDLSKILHQSEKDIFDYFAGEVFAREPDQARELLLRLSLLKSLLIEACSRLYPGFRCSAVPPELLQKNVFLTVAGRRKKRRRNEFVPRQISAGRNRRFNGKIKRISQFFPRTKFKLRRSERRLAVRANLFST